MKFHRFLGGCGLILCALGPLACRREEGTQAPAPPPKAPLAPWSWHALGGLLVIEGEVDQPTELVLKGTTIHERRLVELGPVRWELYRPGKGEKLELQTREGRLLARWDLDRPEEPPPMKAPPTPEPVAPPRPEPPPRPITQGKAARSFECPPLDARGASRKAEPPRPMPPPKPAPRAPEPKRLEPRKVAPKPPESKPPAPSKARPHEAPKSHLPEPRQPEAPPVLQPNPAPTGAWPGSGEGLNVLRGPRGQRQICLTFDGGSTSEVALDVLDALKARGLRCTFFLTGAFIRRFPEIVRRIDREGHEIGNHTLDHPHLAPNGRRDPRWTKERFQQELLAADQALFHLLGRPMDPLWRAPYGEHTLELRKWAEELGYRHVGWSEGADTLDWATRKERRLYRTGNAILDRLHSRMERQDGDGLIVLMHLGSARPAEDRPARVLGPFLDRAIQDGWRFVNVGSYVHASGKPAWERGRRTALLASGASSNTVASQR